MLSTLSLRLREGVETQPMFDRRALPVYAMLGVSVSLAFVVLTVEGYSIDPHYLKAGWSFPILFAAAFLARRVGHSSIAGALEANTLLIGQSVFVYLLLIPLAAWGGPYVDSLLSRADTTLGFNWPAYADAAAPYMPVLFRAYRSFDYQPTLIIILLFWTGREDRAWQLVVACVFALVITAIIFPFVPAKGAFVHYGILHYSGFPAVAEWKAHEALEHIRSGAKLIDHRALGGIVSFPSFHTVIAVSLTWAAWPTKFRYPMLVLNTLMVVAAIVIGSHYLVDIIGGAILACLSIWLAQKLVRATTASSREFATLEPTRSP